MRVNGIVETALTVTEVETSAQFYCRLFGFERMFCDQRLCALNVAQNHVLLLFERGATSEPMAHPGGMIPGHDGNGRMHFAFSIDAADFDGWRDELTSKGIAIESTVQWDGGGRSLYFRDPDQHLVELITPGVWRNY